MLSKQTTMWLQTVPELFSLYLRQILPETLRILSFLLNSQVLLPAGRPLQSRGKLAATDIPDGILIH